MAGYHQFHAVNVALEETLRAAIPAQSWHKAQGFTEKEQGRYDAGPMAGGADGDRRVGVVWHTQGSGKSLTMAFYAGRDLEPQMENPTLVASLPTATISTTSFSAHSALPRIASADAGAGRDRDDLRDCSTSPPAAWSSRRFRNSCRTRREGKPAAFRPAQHRRHCRRGAPQPVRFHRRLRPAHARCAAERLVHRLHRHADREGRRQHAGRVRRLHQHLRHPAGRRGRGDRADLLRKPPGQAGIERGKSPRSTPNSRKLPKARRSSTRKSSRRKWAALEAVVGTDKRLGLIADDLVKHFEKPA